MHVKIEREISNVEVKTVQAAKRWTADNELTYATQNASGVMQLEKHWCKISVFYAENSSMNVKLL